MREREAAKERERDAFAAEAQAEEKRLEEEKVCALLHRSKLLTYIFVGDIDFDEHF